MPVRPLINDAPPGWTASGQTLEPEMTIAGYKARGEELEGGCRAYGCRRKFWLDPHVHSEVVLEPVHLTTVERMLKCGRLAGCQFQLNKPSPRQSIRLTVASGRPNARIKMRCTGCDWTRLPRAQEVVAVLTKARTGGPNTCIHEVAAAMRQPCPSCKVTAWEATLVWLRTDTAIWRAKGELLFDEMQKGGRL